MLNFFKKTSFFFEFRNISITLLLFACFANSAININTAGNAEIADFIVSESDKILQIPNLATLTLSFQTAKDKHNRAGALFFWGEREVSIQADYTLLLNNLDPLKGTVKADTSWLTGYCGMIECRTRPMPAQQRIEVLKTLTSRLLTELNGRFYGIPVSAAPSASTPEPSLPEEELE
ncbi:MAG: hypothetical protein LBC85_02160 [Fibromonadaceae bacterium]|nr:hypothetical protein [Fibromonadaceae bacterium]